MTWLGSKRGYVTDWFTQRWVQFTGRRVTLAAEPWLAGERFGEPGFYFTVHGDSGTVWARYVRALRESIHVFPAERGLLRADHVLTYFGAIFLRLHYRMRPSTK